MQYKDMIMILSAYECDKNCPYCIAKMERLPATQDDISLFKEQINNLIQNKDHFKYFVISGNGETSMYPFSMLKEIKTIVESSGLFEDFRIQTSGNLFYSNDKIELFKNWLIEITRTDLMFKGDSKLLNYDKNYILTENFSKSRIRLNHVLLKSNILSLPNDIQYYFNEYPNIKTLALKLLDTQNNYKNDQTKWIVENGISYDDLEQVKSLMTNNFSYIGYEFNNYLWSYKDNIISLFGNKDYNKDKTPHNLVWYGNKLIY